ncbi:MAG: hypothetical protein ACLQU1_04750 [Bryobacteraceae bacterium]
MPARPLQDGTTKIKVPRNIGFPGRIYDEGSPLRVALAFEQATQWHKQHPPMNFT